MTFSCHLHADLMGTSCQELDFYAREGNSLFAIRFFGFIEDFNMLRIF